MGAVDCPGPRWIGCRIKGSGILTTEPDPNPESHLQGTKGGNPSATDGEISNLGFNICLLTTFFSAHIQNLFVPSSLLISLSRSKPRLRGQVLLICLVNKANLSGECLRIKFIWTSFSARTHLLPFPLLYAEEGSFQ